MKRILIALLLACAPIFAQTPACQTISDTLYSVAPSAPGPMNGTITLSLTYSTAAGGPVTVQSVAQLTVTNGVVSTCLVPGKYIATYQVKRAAPLTGSVTFTRYWTLGGATWNSAFTTNNWNVATGSWNQLTAATASVAQIESPITN